MVDLKTLVDKQIKLCDMDGDVFVGVVCDYFFPEDNSPDFEEEAIAIYKPIKNGHHNYSNPVVFNAHEIRTISIIE